MMMKKTDVDIKNGRNWLNRQSVATTPEQRGKAMRYVAAIAENVEDCRGLLDMLGLTADDRIAT